MKRFTALQFTALAALWLGHASTCAALPEPHPDIAECDRKVREQLKSDLKKREFFAQAIVVTKFADALYSFDESASQLVDPHHELLFAAWNNNRKPRVSNAQSNEANRILENEFYNSNFIQPVIMEGLYRWVSRPGVLHYKCVSEVCPEGDTCTTLYPRQVADGVVNSLGIQRKFFNAAMTWAKKVNRTRKKVPAFERRYNREERKLRATVAKLPERLYVIDTFLPTK
jgi:hypothetical protein